MEPKKPFFLFKKLPQTEDRPQTPLPFFNRTAVQSRAPTAAVATGSGSTSGTNSGPLMNLDRLRGSSPSDGSFASPNGAYKQSLHQNLDSQRDLGTSAQKNPGLARFSAQPGDDEQLQESQQYQPRRGSRIPDAPHEPDDIVRRSDLASPCTQSRLDLVLACQKISALKQTLAMFPNELEKSQAALASANERFAEHVAYCQPEISHLHAELSTATTKNARLIDLKDVHEKEISKLRGVLESTSNTCASLKAGYLAFKEVLDDLKKRQDQDSIALREMKKEIEATRNDAKTGISAVQLAFEPSNVAVKSKETRELFAELQRDLTASQQVTDMLRNKLHIQASQLAESQTIVRDLQDENRHLRQDLDSRPIFDHMVDVENKISHVAEKLAKREEESLDTIVNFSSVQVDLEHKNDEVIRLKSVLQKAENDRDELKVQAEELFLKVQEVTTQLNLLAESKEDTKALVTELKNRLDEKEHAMMDKDANLEDLMAEKRNMKEQLSLASNIETKHLLKIESLKHQYQTVQDSLTDVQQKNSGLEERLQVQSVALFKAKEEISVMKEKMLAEASKMASMQERLASTTAERNSIVNALESRYAAMERAADSDQRSLSNFEGRIGELSSLVERLKHENQCLRDAQQTSALSQTRRTDERILEVQRRNEALGKANEDLQHRMQNILDRYQTNTLSNEERVFVNHIVQATREVRENEMIKKSQDIRLRDKQIQDLNAKIQELETTLARYIKEAQQSSNVNDRSVVALKAYLPSSSSAGDEPVFPEEEKTFIEQSESKPSAAKKRLGRFKEGQEEDNRSTSSLSSIDSHASISAGKKRVRSPTPFSEHPVKAKKRAAKGASPIPAGILGGKGNKTSGHAANAGFNTNRLPHSASPPDPVAAVKRKATGRRRK